MKIFRFFGCVCEPWTLRWLVLSEQAYKTKNIKLALHTNRRNAHVWETGTVISDTSRHAGDLTQSCKSVSQVVLVNETVSVLIHYGKSLQKEYCYTLWFQYAQSDIHHRQICWQSKKKEKHLGRALTSLNSWIWACSNMENTLELAPSPVLFLAFLGDCRVFDNDTLIRSNIRRCDHHLAHRSASLIIGFYCDTGRLW